jgi:putative membrane protein
MSIDQASATVGHWTFATTTDDSMESDGLDGFLPWRASLMLDVVFLAMFLVIPIMAWSIYQVRYHRRYTLHKQVQLALGVVLLVAVGFFEVDMQLFTDWRELAAGSPYYDVSSGGGLALYALWVHLFFAVTTTLLWIYVIVQGLRKFANPPLPNEYSRAHIWWARLAAIDMLFTALTGWTFYYLAFVA